MIKKDYKVFLSISDTIRANVENPADVPGYVENCLLYDVASAAHYYGVTNEQYIYLTNKAENQVIKDNS